VQLHDLHLALRRMRSRRSTQSLNRSSGSGSGLSAVVEIDTKKLRLPEAHWVSEFRDEATGWRDRLGRLIDSWVVEALVGFCIAGDLAVTVLTFTLSDEAADSNTIFITSSCLLAVLLVDVNLRALKEGLRFWYKPLNWLEFIIAVGGGVMLVLDGIRRTCSGGDCMGGGASNRSGTSLGRTIRPIMRSCRIFRTAAQLATSRGGIHKQLDAQADRVARKIIMGYLGDVLLVPQENINVNPRLGKLHLEKAQVRSTAFRGLHLPFTVECGILDLIHLEINLLTPKWRRSITVKEPQEESEARLLVVIENALLVVAPGHHQEPPSPKWDFDNVAEHKQKLIALLTRRMEASAKPKKPGESENNDTGSGKL